MAKTESGMEVRWSKSAQAWVPVPTMLCSQASDPTSWDATAHMMSAPTSVQSAEAPRERQHVSDAAWEAFAARWPVANMEQNAMATEKAGCVLLTVAEHDDLLRQIGYHERMQDKHGSLIENHNDLIARYERLDDEARALRAEVERLNVAWSRAYQMAIENGSHALSLHLENERLRKGVMPNADQEGWTVRPESTNAVAGDASAKTREWTKAAAQGFDTESCARCKREVIVERLRKGRDDERVGDICVCGAERHGDNDAGYYVAGSANGIKGRDDGNVGRLDRDVHTTANPVSMVVADTLDHRLGTQLPDGEPVGPMSGRKAYRWGMA